MKILSIIKFPKENNQNEMMMTFCQNYLKIQKCLKTH
jgi:hypothetical protein